MESPLRELDYQVWSCGVCSQPFKDILILPCQHKFCERCLSIWVGVYVDSYRSGNQEFPCRLCWQLFHMPAEGGLAAYRHSHDVYDLGLHLNRMSMDTAHVSHENVSYSVGTTTQQSLMTSQFDSVTSHLYGDVANSNIESARNSQNSTMFVNAMKENVCNGNTNQMQTDESQVLRTDGQSTLIQHQSQSAPALTTTQNENLNGNTADMAESCSMDELAGSQASGTDTAGGIPMSYPDQAVYGQRLCFPSCHNYMYHLV